MNIRNISKDEQVYDLLKKGLDASSFRSKAIANNIANINTKGYKRQYVTFEETLKESKDTTELKATEDKHIQESGKFGEIKIETDKSSSMREDGNNVDIDNETVNQAANTLMYNALISQVNNRMAMERYVINGR